jgi:hypothetical protein
MGTDDGYANAVIDAVHGLTVLVEEHKRAGEESRQALQSTVEHTVAALRTDVHKAIMSLQLGQADHKGAHEADRVERLTRQATVDLQMAQLRNWMVAMLVGIVALGAFIVGWLVF